MQKYISNNDDDELEEFEVLQLTQEILDDLDPQYKDWINDAKVGDWVLDDGELLASASCVESWSYNAHEPLRSHYLNLSSHLDFLNKQNKSK